MSKEAPIYLVLMGVCLWVGLYVGTSLTEIKHENQMRHDQKVLLSCNELIYRRFK